MRIPHTCRKPRHHAVHPLAQQVDLGAASAAQLSEVLVRLGRGGTTARGLTCVHFVIGAGSCSRLVEALILWYAS